MLRITAHESDDATMRLRLDGKLVGPWVGELERYVSEATREKTLQLDLSGLAFVDAKGAALLLGLLRRGATVSACSGYVAVLLHGEMS